MNGFLTKDEVKELTGYTHMHKQMEWLRTWNIPHYLSRDGEDKKARVIVSWDAVNKSN